MAPITNTGTGRALWLLFGVALVLRAAFVLHHAQLGWQLRFDPGYYLALAESLGHGAYSLFHPRHIPDTTRMPGYPALIHLLGGSIPAVLGVQVLVSASKVLLVHRLAGLLRFPNRAALAAAGLMAVEPVDILLAGSVLTEACFTAALLAGVVVLAGTPSLRHAAVAGALFALAAWFRPTGLPLAACAAAAGLLLWRRPVSAMAVFMGTAILLVLPWMVRNQRETGRFILSDSGPVAAAYFHVPQVLDAAHDPQATAYRSTLDARASSTDWEDATAVTGYFTALRGDLRITFAAHPWAWLRVQARESAFILLAPGRGHIQTFFGDGSGSALLQAVSAIYSGLVALALGLGCWLWIIRRPPAGLLAVTAIALAVLFLGGISTTDARFKNPAMPFLLLGVAWMAEAWLAPLMEALLRGQAARPAPKPRRSR